MFKQMLKADLWIATVALVAIAWGTSWSLVYKFGWRYDDSFDDGQNMFAFLVLIVVSLSCVASPFVVVWRRVCRP